MGRLFNGASSKIVVSGGATIGAPVTYALWFYSRIMPGTSSAGILCGAGESNTGTLSISVTNAFIVNKQDVANFAVSPAVIQPFRWNHAAVSYDQIAVKIYLNGDLISTTPVTTAVTALTKGFGQDLNGPQEFFSGGMSEAAIWSAVLNHNEIKRLAQGISPAAIRKGSLFVYYSMRGPVGANEPDLSGNGRSGTFTNIQPFSDPIIVPPFWPGINAPPLGWINKNLGTPSPGMVLAPRRPTSSGRMPTNVGGARSFNGTSDYLQNSTNPILDYPYTIAAFFNTPTAQPTGNFEVICSVTDPSNFNFEVGITIDDANGKFCFFASDADASPFDVPVVGPVIATNTWYSGVHVGRGPTDRTGYVSTGGNSVQASSAVNVVLTGSTATTTNIGATEHSGVSAFFPGRIAHLAIWNAALTPAEVAAYERGVCPLFIRPGNLVRYWPLDGFETPGKDLSPFGKTARVFGSPVLAAGPPILKYYWPSLDSQFWIPKGVANTTAGMLWGPRRSSRPWTGGARAFNGSSDVITTSRNFDAVAPITVFAWINLATANLDSTFFSTGGTQGLQVRLSSANKLQIIRTNVAIILTSSNAISATGIWVPALVSTDGTDAVTWLEGTRTTAGVGGALLTDPRPYFIGCAADSSNNKLQFWPGSIAHLAVWNRPLRDEEWHQLASGTPPNKIRPGALLAYWPLDGYEAAAKDLSAYGNNGILTGTTLSVGPPYLKNTILQPDINSLFWIPQTTGAAPPPAGAGLGALLSSERSRLINAGLILS